MGCDGLVGGEEKKKKKKKGSSFRPPKSERPRESEFYFTKMTSSVQK